MKGALASLDCISFGVPFALRSESDRLLAMMLESAPLGTRICDTPSSDAREFAVTGSPDHVGYRLTSGGEILMQDGDLQPILAQLARDLMVHVADHAPDRVFVHAGVVGWQGHALLLPGTSFAGKTTLVAELVRAGATYYSDEYAVLDVHGRVHPYARELQMRSTASAPQMPLAVDRLGGIAGSGALPVALVAFVQYVVGSQWRPEPVSAGLAVLEMLRHAIPVRRAPARVMSMLASMMVTATAIRSQRGEANEAAQSLLATMAAGRPAV